MKYAAYVKKIPQQNDCCGIRGAIWRYAPKYSIANGMPKLN
jgi:hypothetical protein